VNVTCRHCRHPLPVHPPEAAPVQRYFCGATCRSAWHRATRQRHLNEALRLVDTWDPRSNLVGDLILNLHAIRKELLGAGARP